MSATATTRVEVEEIETTKSEKLLAVVLAVFLLVGGLWTYHRAGDWVRQAIEPSISAADEAAVFRANAATSRVFRAQARVGRALDELEVAREAYRTALDADQPAGALRLAYEARERSYARARAALREVRAEERATRPAAAAAHRRMAAEQERVADREGLLTFALRFTLVGGLLGSGLWLLTRLRRTGSRWFSLAVAFVAFAALLAFGFAADYLTDYVDPLEFGPLVLSAFGIALTLAAFVALQRYLARRVPAGRVRKGECPFCGYPVGDGGHCEGCGRAVVAPCARCERPRRVGTVHCRACGQA